MRAGFAPCLAAALLAAPPALAQAPAPGDGKTKEAQKPNGAADQQQAITVTGARPEVATGIDRRSYDIRRDIQGQTGSLADVLRNIPSVDVDLQGNVSLRGDSNVTILVDGKPSSLFRGPGGGQTLQSTPANQYERVEVMTNPSAAYSSEGSAGVINLISRRNRAPGVSGSVRAAQGTSGRRNAGGNISRKSGKLTLTADGSWRRDPQHTIGIEHIDQLGPGGAPLVSSRSETRGNGHVELWNARIGADYDLDPTTRISADLHHNSFDFALDTVQHLRAVDSSGTVVRLFDRTGHVFTNRHDTEGSLSLRRTFSGQNHDLNVSLTRERTSAPAGQTYVDADLLPALPLVFDDQAITSRLDRTEAKIDYQGPLGGKTHLRAGTDFEARSNLFDVRGGRGATPQAAAAPSPLFSHVFRFDQLIEAAYATLERPFGKLVAQAGLRLEAVQYDIDLSGSAVRSHAYFHAFPSFHLAYPLNDQDRVTASVSERIVRPQPQEFDPFVVFDDPFHFHAGNPGLQPQLTWSLETGYEHRKGTTLYLATLYYRQAHRGVTDVVTDLGGVLLSTRENLTDSRSLGLELVANGKITRKLGYKLSGNASYYEIDASRVGFPDRRSALLVSGKGSLEWQPDPKDLAQANATLLGNRLTPQGHDSAMLIVNIGYRHKFSQRLWAFVTVQDALHTYQAHHFVSTPLFRDRDDESARTRAAYLGITFNFGGKAAREPGFDFG